MERETKLYHFADPTFCTRQLQSTSSSPMPILSNFYSTPKPVRVFFILWIRFAFGTSPILHFSFLLFPMGIMIIIFFFFFFVGFLLFASCCLVCLNPHFSLFIYKKEKLKSALDQKNIIKLVNKFLIYKYMFDSPRLNRRQKYLKYYLK